MSDQPRKRPLGHISPVPSSYTEDVIFTDLGGRVELRYSYEWNGSMHPGGIRFHKVRAYRFRAESHSTAWHSDKAYDELVEVEDSEWAADLINVQPLDRRDQWTIHHFLVYIDDSGAFEVAAESFEWLQEEIVAHED